MFKTYLYFIVSLIGLCSCDHTKYENYYLPKDFTGNVVVIYKNDGCTPKDINNLFIPTSGILYSPMKFVSGDYVVRYFQKRYSNYYDTLSEVLPGKIPDKTINQIIFPRVLSFEKYQKNGQYTVYTFYVGKETANDLAKDRFFFERQLEQLLLK